MLRASTKFLGVAVLTTLCALAFARPSAGAGTRAQECEANKLKTSGKKLACRMTALAKIATGGTGDLMKCSKKFESAFEQAETRAGVGVCPTEGDVIDVGSAIDKATNELLASLRVFVVNGDGTVTDNQTGLQWEQKDTAVGSGVNLADAHDVDNTYVWSNSGTAPDGPAFTDFLATLNNCVTGGFAGHCDWRLPTREELQTILDVTQGDCGSGSGACIDSVFGPTAAFNYWSDTTFTDNPGFAWIVFFKGGGVFYNSKVTGSSVRAVRTRP